MERITYPLEPVYDANSRVLILGTMASVASRKAGFYYMHRQNRFFPALATALGEPIPESIEARRALVLKHGIALWDVIESCEIIGSSDASIKNPVANDIQGLIERCRIHTVCTTGKKALTLYQKLVYPTTGLCAVSLPSPSPANCALPFDKLVEAYRAVLASALSRDDSLRSSCIK